MYSEKPLGYWKPDRETLSLCQVEVLRLMASGMSPPEVAQHLSVSRETVHRHITRAKRILGARHNYDLLAIARIRGVVE